MDCYTWEEQVFINKTGVLVSQCNPPASYDECVSIGASLSEQALGFSTSTSQIRRFAMAWLNQKIMLVQLSGLRTSVHPSAIRRMKLVGPLIPGKLLLSRDTTRQRRQSGDCLPAVPARGSAPATNKRALPIGARPSPETGPVRQGTSAWRQKPKVLHPPVPQRIPSQFGWRVWSVSSGNPCRSQKPK